MAEVAEQRGAAWSRSTPWRQGSFVAPADAVQLGLCTSAQAEHLAIVVISHDCDLAQDAVNEPDVEVIVGRKLDALDGTFTHLKNLRRLHLPCNAPGGMAGVELEILSRRTVPKQSHSASLSECSPSEDYSLEPADRKLMQRWLAGRYYRAAFPDEFDRRLKSEVTDVADRLARAFKQTGEHVVAVFFDVDDGKEVMRQGADDPYELHITLLYSTRKDPGEAEQAALSAKKRVSEIFEARCRKTINNVKQWQWIELTGIDVVSDRALSYAASLELTRWNADHISLRSDPPQPMFEEPRS